MEKRDDFFNSYYEGFKTLFGVSKKDFKKYYEEALYGGYPEEHGGTIWESEGKSIYVLIRILKPKRILEIGNYRGNSSNHILQAVEANGFGEVVLLDIEERIDYTKIRNRNFKRILANSIDLLKFPHEFDLIIQDGDHTYKHVTKEIEYILKNNKAENYSVWSHDYFTVKIPQCEVARAWNDHKTNFNKFYAFKDSISNCGFCIVTKK
jgi:SAM-dependent methyltransferase